jgi:hypothetical protein
MYVYLKKEDVDSKGKELRERERESERARDSLTMTNILRTHSNWHLSLLLERTQHREHYAIIYIYNMFRPFVSAFFRQNHNNINGRVYRGGDLLLCILDGKNRCLLTSTKR